MKYLELIQWRDSRGHEKRFRVGSEWKTIGNLLDIPADGLAARKSERMSDESLVGCRRLKDSAGGGKATQRSSC